MFHHVMERFFHGEEEVVTSGGGKWRIWDGIRHIESARDASCSEVGLCVVRHEGDESAQGVVGGIDGPHHFVDSPRELFGEIEELIEMGAHTFGFMDL